MDFKNQKESTNFQDDTNPSILQHLRTVVGNYLYTHQWTKGADGKMYDPAKQAAYEANRFTPYPKLDAQGRRADIDWDSNKNIGYEFTPNSPTAKPTAPSGASSGGLLATLFGS